MLKYGLKFIKICDVYWLSMALVIPIYISYTLQNSTQIGNTKTTVST